MTQTKTEVFNGNSVHWAIVWNTLKQCSWPCIHRVSRQRSLSGPWRGRVDLQTAADLLAANILVSLILNVAVHTDIVCFCWMLCWHCYNHSDIVPPTPLPVWAAPGSISLAFFVKDCKTDALFSFCLSVVGWWVVVFFCTFLPQF